MTFWEALKAAFKRTTEEPHRPVSAPAPARSSSVISRGEYEGLVMVTAQGIAGFGRPVTAIHLAQAKPIVDSDLRRRGVKVQGWHEASMGIWKKIKRGLKKAGGVAKQAAPVALPILAPAVAAPFIFRAVEAQRQRKAAAAAPTEAPAAVPSEDELEAILGAGGAELAYWSRVFGAAPVPKPGVNHNAYRTLVLSRAKQRARKGGRRPTTKDIFVAQIEVDDALGRRGLRIFIPGARPARITR